MSFSRKPGWQRFADARLDYAAHCTAATARHGREGLPCIGLSIDRCQLSQLAEAAHSDSIRSYMCLCLRTDPHLREELGAPA